jgi:class 3 adenylate cyclase
VELPPETRYVDRGGSALAYQVFGDGPDAAVIAADVATHLELIWTDPGYAALLGSIGDRARVAMFERHGTGLSDPLPTVRPVEDEADDLIAVMDACGMQRALVAAVFTRAPGAILAAARHPDRITALALATPLVQGWRSAPPEELEGWTPEAVAAWDERFERVMADFGTGAFLRLYAPGLESPANLRIWGLLERSSASPGVLRAHLEAAARVDVREVLGLVRAPTLVMYTADFPWPRDVFVRIADAIPGARLFDAPGGRPDMSLDEFWRPFTDEALRLLGDAAGTGEVTRRLVTVLFTDIVGSTKLAAELGDAGWRALLERHDALVVQAVHGARGSLVKRLGDGALSAFDGPAQAIRAARRLREAAGELGIEIRAGVHTGECEVRGGDLAGIAVHIGARVSATAAPGEILVSRTVRDLVVGSGIAFASRGSHALKGVPGEWELFAVTEGGAPLALPREASPLRLTDRMVLAGARRTPVLMRRLNGVLSRAR